MFYEIRTYDLQPRSVPEWEKRFGEKLPERLEFSPLGGLWHTEVGPPNQVSSGSTSASWSISVGRSMLTTLHKISVSTSM